MENQNATQPATAVVPETLNPQQALSVLIQGVHFAQSKGVFTLKDAALLDKAVSVFASNEPAKNEAPATAEATAPAAETTPAN